LKKIVIALDGYSSCGKSTTAKRVAAALGYRFIDTGAMYRAVTLFFIQNHISLSNPKEIDKALAGIEIHFEYNPMHSKSDVYLNGLNVEDEIRKMYVTNLVSEVSAITTVRRAMVAQQQRMGKRRGLVMDGRDIGTMVFPDAEVKIFMKADTVVRAQRRQQELLQKGEMIDLDEIIENIKKRDIIDSTRHEGPLRKATEAIELDTTHMTLDEQVDFVVALHDAKWSKILRK
jgi:CMP/dCMP kinase